MPYYYGSSFTNRVPTIMRLSKDGLNIETSQGATFPAEHGRKAWRVLRLLYAKGATFQRNGHSIHLGHFQIDRVTEDGTVYAGCHIVPRESVEEMAAMLGLEPVPAS